MSPIRLLSYNIKRGGAGREDALLSVIRSCAPDIVVFQEATVPAVIERLSQERGCRTGRRCRGCRSDS